jgi:hypothetical protein
MSLALDPNTPSEIPAHDQRATWLVDRWVGTPEMNNVILRYGTLRYGDHVRAKPY